MTTITDAQVHIWSRVTPGGRPHLPHGFSADELLSRMDEASVQRAVLVPPSWGDDGNSLALRAAETHPERFAVMGIFSWDQPSAMDDLRSGLQHPKMLGIRQAFVADRNLVWLEDGTAERIWSAAEAFDIPVMVYPPGHVHRFAGIAHAHPGLRLIIDHLGLPPEMRPDELALHVAELTRLATLPNVAVKITALPLYSRQLAPYRDLHSTICHVIDLFGSKRTFWGSDLSRLRCDYAEVVEMGFALPCLTLQERDMVMGDALCDWLRWTT